MSLAINVDRISEVLLTDGWHAVADFSFDLDAYEYVDEVGDLIHVSRDRITSTGFAFVEADDFGHHMATLCGPVTSILAVRYRDQ